MPNSAIKFFIPTKDIKGKIKRSHSVRSVDFTILNQSIEFQDSKRSDRLKLDTLDLCIEAYPKEFIRKLVCLNPKRLITHEILAQLQANIKQENSPAEEDEFFQHAYSLLATTLEKQEDTKTVISACIELHKTLFDQITQFFIAMQNQSEPNKQAFGPREIAMMQSFYHEIATKDPWAKNSKKFEIVFVQRSLAAIYTARCLTMIQPLIAKGLAELCESKQLSPLAFHPKAKAIAIFMTGGVASGKGTCLSNIQETLLTRSDPIAWNELVHHNADRIKPLLLDSTQDDRKRFSQYTYDEALLVKDRVMQLISENGSQNQCYPHFLHDQTKLKPEELIEASHRYGQLIIAAVSTEVGTAIERAFYRGQKTRRFEHTEGLLGSHQAVPGEFMKSLNSDQLIGCNISVAMYDNNSSQLIMFASIDMASSKITIYDEECMKNWIKKETINLRALDSDSLYTGIQPRSIKDYFGPLLIKGFELNDQSHHVSYGPGYSI